MLFTLTPYEGFRGRDTEAADRVAGAYHVAVRTVAALPLRSFPGLVGEKRSKAVAVVRVRGSGGKVQEGDDVPSGG